jgi:hypothetical protein
MGRIGIAAISFVFGAVWITATLHGFGYLKF